MGKMWCLVCGASGYKFHRFPADADRLKIWCEALQLDIATIRKYSYICLNHFKPSDVMKIGNKAFISSTAVPAISLSSQIQIRSDLASCDSAVTRAQDSEIPNQATTSNSVTATAKIMSKVETSDSTTNAAGTSESMFDSSATMTATSSSSATISASELPSLGSSSTDTAETSSQIDVQPSPIILSCSNRRKRLLQLQNVETSGYMEPLLTPVKKRRFAQPRFFGDIETDDLEDPIKRKVSWNIIKKTVTKQKQKIRRLQARTRWLKNKVYCLQSLTRHLKQKNLISEQAEDTLNGSMSASTEALFKRMLRSKGGKYPPELRQFALTLHFYSRKAYEYVRTKFNKALPHIRTIAKWLSTIDATPGLMKEAQQALKIKAAEAECSGKQILCNLVLDEMAIKKKIEWDGTKTYGYIDIGTQIEGDNLEEVKEALVFMLVSLNSNWKVPVGYFLINGLSGNEKANLVTNCLEFVHETNIVVTSITFDGAPANLAMARTLGANFNLSNFITYFFHPITNNKVYIFLDACHMIKLIRNCLGSKKCLEDPSGNFVEWKYFEKLCEVQEYQQLHAATKLRRRHLNWIQEKMKVSLAVQTLSKSVADALDFINHDLKFSFFQNSAATANFCRIINNLFDILNSRNRLCKKPYEKPLSPATQEEYFTVIESGIEYIKQLKLENVNILQSNRKVGFLGLIISLNSLKELYIDRVQTKKSLKYILSYKLSQDHLEIFFSCVRSKCGFNNNPTSKQFQSVMKRLLIHTEVRGSESANCIAIDSTSILHCSSSSLTRSRIEDDNIEPDNVEDIQDHSYCTGLTSWQLTLYVTDVIAYIAGFVVRKCKKVIKCDKCLDMLEANHTASKLQNRKTYGIMTNASYFVIELCKLAEKYLRFNKDMLTKNKDYTFISNYLIFQTQKNLPDNIKNAFSDHLYDDEPLSNHFILLTKKIAQIYFELRLHFELSKIHASDQRVRHELTKRILFHNQ